MFSDAYILTGPTGSGKTALALDLAEAIHGEVVAMDSMTLYRGMDIGTAKPTRAEQVRVRHHLVDVLEPWESANVAWWLAMARCACADIRRRGKVPLLVGGTPFYLKAILHGLFDAPPVDIELRARLEAEAADVGPTAFHQRLADVDPVAAAKLHPNDVRRVVRAREVFALTGQPLSSFQQSWATAATPIPAVVLDLPRDVLYARIDQRVKAMLDAGWLDEARRLSQAPRPPGKEASQALGYAELFAHLAGTGPTRDETIVRIQTRTRQFAKRQLTWFRSLPCKPVPAGGPDTVARILSSWAEI